MATTPVGFSVAPSPGLYLRPKGARFRQALPGGYASRSFGKRHERPSGCRACSTSVVTQLRHRKPGESGYLQESKHFGARQHALSESHRGEPYTFNQFIEQNPQNREVASDTSSDSHHRT